MEKIEKIGEFDKVIFRREKRFVRMTIRISSEAEIIVNVPKKISMSLAKEWFLSKSDWVKKTLNKINIKLSEITVFRRGTVFQIYKYKVEITEGDGVDVKDDVVRIGVPSIISNENIVRKDVQDTIRGVLDGIFKKVAQVYLMNKVEELAKRFNFSFSEIKFRKNKSCWGSCSGCNNISLNTQLVRLPEYLIDYVILHELCHTVEKNHSSSFWELLKNVCPDSEKYRKEMKQYSTVNY